MSGILRKIRTGLFLLAFWIFFIEFIGFLGVSALEVITRMSDSPYGPHMGAIIPHPALNDNP